MKSFKKNRIAKRSKEQPFPAFRASNAITNPYRPVPRGKKEGQFRDKSTIKRLNMYREKPDFAKMRAKTLEPVRIHPDRRWFGNTRVITQKQMENFRNELNNEDHHPGRYILKRSKLPISLLNDSATSDNAKILTIEPFEATFGGKSRRKRPKLSVSEIEELAMSVKASSYNIEKDGSLIREALDAKDEALNAIFKKGTSKRIWTELYKVIDCSDVIVQVIDARDPIGTRCLRLEKYIREHRQSKIVLLLMNKCDLVPSWVTAAWIKHLNRTVVTVAFHASVTNPFGKNTLLQLLKQYSKLFKDRKHFSVGFIGYPNVGKSSVINTLKGKKNCKTAPIPGETRVWQYVSLTKRIHLIDCPGITPAEDYDETDKVLKGAIRIDRISDPECHIGRVLELIDRDILIERYGISEDFDENSFLDLVASKFGKFKKGKVPDISAAARIVLYDFQRGRLPFYTEPPKDDLKVDPTTEIRKNLEELGEKEMFSKVILDATHSDDTCDKNEQSTEEMTSKTQNDSENSVSLGVENVSKQTENVSRRRPRSTTPLQLPGVDYDKFLC